MASSDDPDATLPPYEKILTERDNPQSPSSTQPAPPRAPSRPPLEKPKPGPIRELVPDLPPVVARVIDQLLATRIEDRFRSAIEVLAALRGHAPSTHKTQLLPWLGSRRPLEAIVEAAAKGRSLDIVGPPGAGRSRCLLEAAELLQQKGFRVAFVEPARSPLASLLPIVGTPTEQATLSLAEAWVEEKLRHALAQGLVVLVDATPPPDRWSTAILDRCRKAPGPLLRAFSTPLPEPRADRTVVLQPLDEASLRPLFAGPDRLFHLREDAARLLWERSEGLPARIEAELTLWTRLSLARWDGTRLVLSREALDRLHAGLLGTPPTHSMREGIPNEPQLEELLRWLAIGGHHLELPQLAEVMRQPIWKLEAECEALVSRGAARRLDALRVVPSAQVDITWQPSRRLAAHQAIAAALRPGQEGRLCHLLAAEQARDAAREAVELAQRHAREGALGAASMALAEGLRVARQEDDLAEEESRILAEWVKVAFAKEIPLAQDQVLYEISQSRARASKLHHAPLLERLDVLVRAAIAAPGAGTSWALERMKELEPFADPELERHRQGVRVAAATARASLPLLEAILDDIAAWSAQSHEPLAELSWIEGRARLCYLQGRFEEAAELHKQAAGREPLPTGRIAAMLNAASAQLEAFQHREAEQSAAAGKKLAARYRHPAREAKAEWLLRSARYRMAEAGAPDLELVEAVARVGVPKLEALVCLNEAAAAFRIGALETTVSLAERSTKIWRELNRPGGVLLGRCLSLACGASAQPGEVDALIEEAVKSQIPGIGVQALGLLGRAFPEARSRWKDAVSALLEGICREHWDLRIGRLEASCLSLLGWWRCRRNRGNR